MFDIEVAASQQIALVCFGSKVSSSDFAQLDILGAYRGSGANHYDLIFDFSNVEKSDLEVDFVAARGRQPQLFPGRDRIFVVPQADLRVFLRLFAATQADEGWREPVVVNTLGEAFDQLGCERSVFRRLDLGL